MEMYKKPIMKIVDLEKIDIMTASGEEICQYCGGKIYTSDAHGNKEGQCSPGVALIP